MGWTWNGTTSDMLTTIAAVDTGSWTIAAKVYARSQGEGTQGFVASVSGASAVQSVKFNPTLEMTMRQNHATAGEDANCSTANRFLYYQEWAWVVGVYDDSLTAGKRAALWVGNTFKSPVNITSSVVAASGARLTGATSAHVGQAVATTRTWDGYIEDAIFDTTAWSAPQIQAFWEGWVPHGVSTLAWWLPLTEVCASATQAPIDQGAGLTWTTAAMAQGPRCPIAMRRKVFSLYAPVSVDPAPLAAHGALPMMGVG